VSINPRRSQPLVARLRHGKIAGGLPLWVQERSCGGHHCHNGVWSEPDL